MKSCLDKNKATTRMAAMIDNAMPPSSDNASVIPNSFFDITTYSLLNSI